MARRAFSLVVMAALEAAIQQRASARPEEILDGRVEPGHDEEKRERV